MSPYEIGRAEGRAWAARLLFEVAHRLANHAQVARFGDDPRERLWSHAAVALRTIGEELSPGPLEICQAVPRQRVERLAMAIQRAEIADDDRAYRPCAIDMGCHPC